MSTATVSTGGVQATMTDTRREHGIGRYAPRGATLVLDFRCGGVLERQLRGGGVGRLSLASLEATSRGNEASKSRRLGGLLGTRRGERGTVSSSPSILSAGGLSAAKNVTATTTR